MFHSKITLLKAKYPTIKEIRRSIVDDIITVLAKNNIHFALDNLELYLIIDEAVTNAMEHGNKWNQDKYVHIDVAKDTDQLYITITDEGKGFTHHPHPGDHLQPRGRGIFIIKQFARVSWNRKGNSITMAIPILHTDTHSQ